MNYLMSSTSPKSHPGLFQEPNAYAAVVPILTLRLAHQLVLAHFVAMNFKPSCAGNLATNSGANPRWIKNRLRFAHSWRLMRDSRGYFFQYTCFFFIFCPCR